VERLYARALYPRLADLLGRPGAWLPFSLGEVLLLGLLGALVWGLGVCVCKALRSRREALRAFGRGVLGVAVAGSVLYAGFVLAWGLNYRRPPLAERLGWPGGAPTLTELQSLAGSLIPEVNSLRASLGTGGAPDPERVLGRVDPGFMGLERLLGPLPARLSRPKQALLHPVMTRSLTYGMLVPWTLEALVNPGTPAPALPFAACHERAHQLGIAREDEANFVGYLAARAHPDPDFRYSAQRFALQEVMGQLALADPEAFQALRDRLDPAVREEYRLEAAWARRHRSRFSEVQGRVYDRYLKAQGQREGVRSYGRVVDLLIAERRLKEGGGTPPS
jgi:hypothetical protein